MFRMILITMSLFLIPFAGPVTAADLAPVESLGRALFFDPQLSNPPGQSCASCHDPAVGWTGPDPALNATGAVMEGAVHTRYGNRKPPSSAYAGFNPALHCVMSGAGPGGGGMGSGGMGGGMGNGGMGTGGICEGKFAGGMFWDGRATGWTLGDPLAEQAMGPFQNPLEMNSPNQKLVCLKVRESVYAGLFEEIWGANSLDCVKDVGTTYERIAQAIAAYERSTEVNPFSSKFDQFWRNRNQARAAGQQIPPVQNINMMNSSRFKNLGLSDMELMGLVIFNTKGKCSICHLLQPMRGSDYPLFTDFQYHNVGIPKNLENPFYTMPRQWNADGGNWVDTGLGGFLEKTQGMIDASGMDRDYTTFSSANLGNHKTPTLRNVDMRPSPEFVKAFGHNGYFKSLMEIVHFYNCRDVPFEPQCTMLPPFPGPEVSENMNTTDMGNLGLTQQ